MENVNQTVINNANTVFEKKDDKYFGYKSRFGDIVIGGAYSYRFVVHYAKTNQDVVIISGDVNTVTTPVCTTLEERLWKPEKSAQALRDEIVEQAKADVEKLIEDAGSICPVYYGNYTMRECTNRVEFVVNREKRTVVALVFGKSQRVRSELREKGIAKAAPNDCFNAHIGKAIALRRALGLAVPDEYLNAPQPTEVRVGDVIEVTLDSGEIEKKPVISLKAGSLNAHLPGRIIQYPSHYAKIINDSREEVGGE
ncbi:hypothetical protein SRCM100169_02124 [Bacillus siamensis]|uniref:hypothetical protein n=1 Tax=Bacillus siamensis TaxID=659243 RepID=UPI0007E9F05B|nr:hypothetical protein [Bacillus siamensis]OAZ62901.1 hypothetical protein SRCM100169_02124 [Bacillus siamensis]